MSRKKRPTQQIAFNFDAEKATDSNRKIVKAISSSKVLDYFNRLNKSKWASDFSKLLLNLEGWESPLCRLNWKIRSGKNNRVYFYLQVINSNKNGAENNLLLTPSTVEIPETPEKFQERHKERTRKGLNKAPHPGNKYNCLTSQILYSGLLPTPIASLGGGSVNTDRKSGNYSGNPLKTWAVNGLLPTPRTTDVEGGKVDNVQCENGSYFRENKDGVRWGVKLRDVVENGLLPTPQAMDVRTDVRKPEERSDAANKGGCSNLREFVVNQMLPTPQARDWKAMQGQAYKGEAYDLPGVVNGMLPTPNASDRYNPNMKDGHDLKKNYLRGVALMHPTSQSEDFIENTSKESLETDGENEPNSLSDKFAESGKSVMLNPLFVTEMMGFPVDWLILPNIEQKK